MVGRFLALCALVAALSLAGCVAIGAIAGATSDPGRSDADRAAAEAYVACRKQRDAEGQPVDCTGAATARPAATTNRTRGQAAARGALFGLGIDAAIVLVFLLALSSQ